MQSWTSKSKMRRFFIITNEHKDEGLEVTREIKTYIEKKGGSCRYFVSTKSNWHASNADGSRELPKDAECILVLGGDGTLVRAARDYAGYQIPLIGVNLGTLGYLCELERRTVFSAIDRLFEDEYDIEERMLLGGSGMCKGKVQEEKPALNDIVIHRTGASQVINLVVSVNGEYLTTYSADGIILATPTGSTGYSMSAGGPIVDPKAELIVITPINSHDINSKSIVVGSDAVVTIEIAQRRTERDEEADVSFDGDRSVPMGVGDRLVVKRADRNTRILRLNRVSFLQILRKKMQEYHH